MKVLKYYVIRLAERELIYIKDSKGCTLEFDTEAEARKVLIETEREHPFWFMGWKKEEIEI